MLAALVLLCLLPELLLLGADWGLWGTRRWRPLSYQYGAFWAGLLHGWRPNYAAQPWAMFLTHGFLHAGPGHLAGNLLVLVWLGRQALDRLGQMRFASLYLGAMLGGALAFGLLTRSPAPMVGASGALFGLAAAWIVWDWRRRAGESGPLRRAAVTLGQVLAVAGFNLAAWIVLAGQIAWETHLGGFLAGGVLALMLRRHRPGA